MGLCNGAATPSLGVVADVQPSANRASGDVASGTSHVFMLAACCISCTIMLKRNT